MNTIVRTVVLTLALSLSAKAASLSATTRKLTSPLGPVVDLGYAAYAGNSSLAGVTFWGGIPYIQPPVGNLRFRPPQPLAQNYDRSLDSSRIVDARNWGPLCIQQPAVVGFGAEDCVTLNVWAPPAAKDGDKLPVYVYIHGGGYYYNSAQGFPGNDWVSKADGPIIVVNIQYRLGLLGFLAGTPLKNDRASSVNNGLLDQREALKWVQQNIHYFGGDPAKVTIGGESTGAGSVVHHLTAYGGEKNPPFRAAVIQSAGNDPLYRDAQTETCFAAVTKLVGCEGSSNIMACWRKATIGAIVSAVNNKPSTCKFLPVIDGKFILDITSKQLAAGKFSKVPILAGHTAQDGSIFVNKPEVVIDDASVIASVRKRPGYLDLSDATMARMLEVYPAPSDSTPWKTQWERSMFAYMETEFACWDFYIAQQSGKKSYNYRWDATDPNLLASRGAYVGAAHTADLFYLYMGTNSGPSASVLSAVFSAMTPEQSSLATTAVTWWTKFARNLDPNFSGGVQWDPISSGGFMAAKLGGPAMESRDPALEGRCAFWRSVADELRL